MARRAIQDLFKELELLKQEIRLLKGAPLNELELKSTSSPPTTLALSSLLPGLPLSRKPYPEAAVFVPTMVESDMVEAVLTPSGDVGENPSFTQVSSATEFQGMPDVKDSQDINTLDQDVVDVVADAEHQSPHSNVCPALPPFRDYYRANFKCTDIHSMSSLVGCSETPPQMKDDDALDRPIEFVRDCDCECLVECSDTCSYVAAWLRKVLPVFIQTEGQTLKELESRSDQAAVTLRQQLKVRLWKELAPAIQNGGRERVKSLKIQWHRTGLK